MVSSLSTSEVKGSLVLPPKKMLHTTEATTRATEYVPMSIASAACLLPDILSSEGSGKYPLLTRFVHALRLSSDHELKQPIMNTVIELDGELTKDTLISLVQDQWLSKYKQLSMIPCKDESNSRVFQGWFWANEYDFSIENHIEEVDDVMNNFDEKIKENMPCDQPLWKIYVSKANRKSKVLLRMHHSLGDGAALMMLLLKLCNYSRFDRVPVIGKARASRHQWLGSMLGMTQLHKILGKEDRGYLANIQDDHQGFNYDVINCSIEKLKQAAKNNSLTLNEQILLSLTKSIREYLLQRSQVGCARSQEMLENGKIKVRVPVNLESLEERDGKGEIDNKVISIKVRLPITCDTDDQVIDQLKKNIIKAKRRIPLLASILNNAESISDSLLIQLGAAQISKSSMTVSSVPGPDEEVNVGGCAIKNMRTLMPVNADGMTLLCMSYNGNMSIQLNTARDLVDEPDTFYEIFKNNLPKQELEV